MRPTLKSSRCEMRDATFWLNFCSCSNRRTNEITSWYRNYSKSFVFKALTTFSTILATYFLASPLALPWRAKMAANAMMGMSVVQVSRYSFEDLFVVTFFNMFIKKPTCFYVNLFLSLIIWKCIDAKFDQNSNRQTDFGWKCFCLTVCWVLHIEYCMHDIYMFQVGLGITTLLLYVPTHLAATHQFGSLTLLSLAIWFNYELRTAKIPKWFVVGLLWDMILFRQYCETSFHRRIYEHYQTSMMEHLAKMVNN